MKRHLAILILAVLTASCTSTSVAPVASSATTIENRTPVPPTEAQPAAAASQMNGELPDISRDLQQFAREMALKHNFDEATLRATLSQAELKPNIIRIMNRPGESKPWHEYRAMLITPAVVANGVKFLQEYEAPLAQAEAQYQVPREIIAAIIGVETRFGQNKGSFRIMDALLTLGFAYPRRAEYFKSELEQFLLMTREEQIDPFSVKGSFAGAFGWPQFMPSSFRKLAVDFDRDGRRDLLNSPVDAIGSVARYFQANGWQPGQAVAQPAVLAGAKWQALLPQGIEPRYTPTELQNFGVSTTTPVDAGMRGGLFMLEGKSGPEYWVGYHNFKVITRYNKSRLYAMAVSQLSEEIRKSANR